MNESLKRISVRYNKLPGHESGLNFDTAGEFKKCTSEYFRSLAGVPYVYQNGKGKEKAPMINKRGEVVWKRPPKPPTLAGLARHLGFSSMDDFMQYVEAKFDAVPESERVIYRNVCNGAILQIRAYNEERLYDREGNKGAEFQLTNQYGYKDKRIVGFDNSDEGFKVNVVVEDKRVGN